MAKKTRAKRSFSLALALLLCLLFSACAAPRPDEANWQQSLAAYIKAQGLPEAAAPAQAGNFYEIFVASFYDSDGDGGGDLAGVAQMLDYVQYMGFGGIWLMPIHPSPSYHKYDVTDYFAIAPAYGTLADFERLAAECAQRGIRLILDLVLNHTSSQHPWFTQAVAALAAGEESPYIGYYNFSTENPGGWHVATAAGGVTWYYEGAFWDGMPDLNLDNPALRQEIVAILRFWLEKGAGGFRLDAVTEYYGGNTAKNVQFLQWLRGQVQAIDADAYLVGEAWVNSDALYAYYESGLDSFFAFPFAQSTGFIASALLNPAAFSAESYMQAMESSQQAIRGYSAHSFAANFFTNHDTARASGFLRRDENLIKLGWAMNILQPGYAFVYYGEEIAMAGSGRDENKRAPMLWSASPQATGITNPPPGMETVTHSFPPAIAQLYDEGSILHFVRSALLLRAKYPAIAHGLCTAAQPAAENPAIALSRREYEGYVLYVAYNLGGTGGQASLAGLGSLTLADVLSAGGEKAALENESLYLPPYTIAILVR